jgi:hypothetical protein
MRKEGLEVLRSAIAKSFGCGSFHLSTVAVRVPLKGDVQWKGHVEIFSLSGHPHAHRCYAWFLRRDDRAEIPVVILKIPPVDSPFKAVQAYLADHASP